MKALKQIDLFGKEFHFLIDNGKYKSIMGGLLTIFLILSSITCFFYFGRDIFERQSPLYIKEEKQLLQEPYINMSQFNGNLTFYFNIHDSNSFLSKLCVKILYS